MKSGEGGTAKYLVARVPTVSLILKQMLGDRIMYKNILVLHADLALSKIFIGKHLGNCCGTVQETMVVCG